MQARRPSPRADALDVPEATVIAQREPPLQHSLLKSELTRVHIDPHGRGPASCSNRRGRHPMPPCPVRRHLDPQRPMEPCDD